MVFVVLVYVQATEGHGERKGTGRRTGMLYLLFSLRSVCNPI
jgi:hypothetical protein